MFFSVLCKFSRQKSRDLIGREIHMIAVQPPLTMNVKNIGRSSTVMLPLSFNPYAAPQN